MNHKKRKLRAILFADIVGYTALMQKDEQTASKLLRHFQQQLEQKVTEYNGQIVNFYGDGALCTFQIPVDAVRCAMALQTTFQKAPNVPVRIGIHSGTVTYEGDKIFGNSVNITSRIESMGVAGGVLLSKKVRDEVKNNPDLEMQSLGSFEFKNVEESMEVFALANEELVIPDKKNITGKLKTSTPKNNKWLWPTIIGALLLGVFGYWQWNTGNSLTLSVTDVKEPAQTPLSKEIRAKRVAVMVFDNQTMSAELDAFGKMISDWVTRGLMETGEANVISAANIQHQIAKTGLLQGANPAFAEATGVDVMLQGRYYLQENRLIIHANIVEIASGEVIHALTPIEGDKSKIIDLLDELTQEVLGYWAVKKRTRFLQNPPKYEAFQHYVEGERNTYIDFKKAETYLWKAFQLDSTFYAPLLKLIPLYRNKRFDAKVDSIITFFDKKSPALTQWEKLRLESLMAAGNWETLKSAELNEKRFRMDPSDETANYNAASRYLQANYPLKTISLITEMEDPYRDKEEQVSWHEERLAFAYNRTGQPKKALEVAATYTYPKMYVRLVNAQLKAFIMLDSTDAFVRAFNKYVAMDLYRQNGNVATAGQLYESTCNDLLIANQNDLLQEIATRFQQWAVAENKTEDQARAYFYLKEYQQVIDILENQPIDTFPTPLTLRRMSLLGVVYALNGNPQKSKAQNKKIKAIRSPIRHWEAFQYYYIAPIEAALGNKEKAMNALKKSRALKMAFWNYFFQEDALLQPLFGYAPFEELVQPKG
ncbi:MAG: adenylate/guanylate cyclase domain-containing protein [Bacteroidota bacterium]